MIIMMTIMRMNLIVSTVRTIYSYIYIYIVVFCLVFLNRWEAVFDVIIVSEALASSPHLLYSFGDVELARRGVI